MTIAELAPLFHDLFAGMSRCHGVYNNIRADRPRSDGKLEAADHDKYTSPEPVTDALWESHLKGHYGLGVVPIREDSTAVFGATDIDVYAGLDLAQIAAKIRDLKLPLIPCRSKSGGCHAYIFTSVAVPAKLMVEKLREMAAALGFGASEIFPKQTHVTDNSKDLGSWINMPYFDASKTERYAVDPDGKKLSAEEFLDYVEQCKVGIEFFQAPETKKKKDQTPGEKAFPDGPPCLQLLASQGIKEANDDGRKRVLFNMGIYFRKASPDFVKHIESANREFMIPPLPAAEIQNISRSVGKTNYKYQCEDPSLKPYCNASACRMRKYGVGASAAGFPILNSLRKLLTEPPMWFLTVEDPKNGDLKVLEINAIEELDDPTLFKRKCMTYLDIVPIMPTKIIWNQIIAELISKVELMAEPPSEARGAEGQFWELLEEFCTDRAQAETREGILLGMPYTEEGRTYFRMRDLLQFLKRKHFTDMKPLQISKSFLRPQKDFVDKHVWYLPNCTNLWSVPAYRREEAKIALPVSLRAVEEKEF